MQKEKHTGLFFHFRQGKLELLTPAKSRLCLQDRLEEFGECVSLES